MIRHSKEYFMNFVVVSAITIEAMSGIVVTSKELLLIFATRKKRGNREDLCVNLMWYIN